jgi:photosystem II stability/assembly factor-like uncharacterized protein
MGRKMRTLKISLLVFILSITISAQWYQQNSGTTAELLSVTFTDVNYGSAVGTSGTILSTTNAGSTWITQTSGTSSDLIWVDFYNSSLGYVVGSDGVILKTTNGGYNWFNLQSGTNYDIRSISSPEENIGYIIYSNYIAKTTNGGESWTVLDNFPGDLLYAMCFSDSSHGTILTIYQYGQTSKILRTNDGGNSWIEQNSGVYAYLLGVDFVDAFNGIIVGMNGIIIRTTDGGNTWINSVSGTLKILEDVSYSDINNATAVGYEGTILRTTNGGNSWTNQVSNTNLRLMAVSFPDSDNGTTVGVNGTILHTSNGGVPVELTSFIVKVLENKVELTWSTATETNNSGFEILRGVYPAIGGTQNDNSWKSIGFVPGFGTTTEPKSYSFTDEDVTTGIYRYCLKQIDFDGTFEYSNEIDVEIDITLKEYFLYQNYPNPFNPTTTIKYDLPNKSDVSLIIYDMLGRKVKELVNTRQQAGRYEIHFNSSTLTSGVYFYQIIADKFINSRKMILQK